MDSGDTTCIARCSVNGEGSVDITSRLVKLNGLPSVFGGLRNAWTLNDTLILLGRWVTLGLIALLVCCLDVSLDLILAKSKRQIQLESLIVLTRLRLLEACSV